MMFDTLVLMQVSKSSFEEVYQENVSSNGSVLLFPCPFYQSSSVIHFCKMKQLCLLCPHYLYIHNIITLYFKLNLFQLLRNHSWALDNDFSNEKSDSKKIGSAFFHLACRASFKIEFLIWKHKRTSQHAAQTASIQEPLHSLYMHKVCCLAICHKLLQRVNPNVQLYFHVEQSIHGQFYSFVYYLLIH